VEVFGIKNTKCIQDQRFDVKVSSIEFVEAISKVTIIFNSSVLAINLSSTPNLLSIQLHAPILTSDPYFNPIPQPFEPSLPLNSLAYSLIASPSL
jgi:hypothetical protein